MSDKVESVPITIQDLKAKVASYYPDADLGLLQKAHDFSVKLHGSQKRQSGEPYIIHPLHVSAILADMRMDLATIATGLLHDTVEDTITTIEEIQNLFGSEIAQLVDGVTKISQINFRTSTEKQAENFRKMVLAMAKDLRVIIVKLADRTHNMRTLEFLAEPKQQKIAQETLDIYAPLANRLGISWMKIELEDLSLRYIRSEVYYKLARLVAKKKNEREEYTQKLISIITEKVNEYGIKVKVTGRAKHFYSIYKKMEARGIDFEELHDIVAFRIITQSVGECYEALGIIHSFFKPVPGRFKDYIAMPKNNMYQSLHTTVIGPFGERLEVQIRTEDMHRVAESGIAAHWEYKDGKMNPKDAAKFHWLRQLVEAQETIENSAEFLESVKLDLFEGDIYVFSPKGDLLELPSGSTPLDFAYTIHTELGHKCTGAKVNGRIVPLKHKLRSGDTIEITTNPTQKPSKDWLKIVRTSRAKSKIRLYVRTEERERSKQIGRDMLDREFRRYGQSLAKFEKNKNLAQTVSGLSFASFDEMLISVGYGKVPAERIVHKVFPDLKPTETAKEDGKSSSVIGEIFSRAKERLQSSGKKSAVLIEGLDDILVRFGKCCNPLPGDDIRGFISRGRGVTVHKVDCKKAMDADPDREVDVRWAENSQNAVRDVRIKIVCQDEPGLLNDMSRVITSQGINIKSFNIRVGANNKAIGNVDIQVRNRLQVLSCIKALEGLRGVISVDRV